MGGLGCQEGPAEQILGNDGGLTQHSKADGTRILVHDSSDHNNLPPPPKRKMAVFVIVALYPLLMALHFLLIPLFVLAPIPYPLQLLVTVIVGVFIMKFFLMPFMTRLFAHWLHS